MSDDNPSIISHISVGTNDFARAAAFYEVVLAHAKQLPTEVMTLFLQDAAVALKVIAPDGSTYPLKSSVPAENRSDLSDPPTQQSPRQIDETEHVTPEPDPAETQTSPILPPEIATDPDTAPTIPREI